MNWLLLMQAVAQCEGGDYRFVTLKQAPAMGYSIKRLLLRVHHVFNGKDIQGLPPAEKRENHVQPHFCMNAAIVR